MRSTRKIATVAGLLMATMFVNQECQSQTATPPAPAATQPAAPPAGAPSAMVPAAGTASAKAVVKFTGTPPAMPKLKREADPFCGKTPMNDQEIVVNPNGTLKNVAVRVTQGAPASATPLPDAKVVDQSNCMYAPRLIVGQTGQKLLIKNSDPIMHNVHTYQGTTTGFNQAQMKGSKDIEKTIAAGVTKFKCDVHPWMTGYTVGSDNPYICVTGDTGECDLGALAPGAYTIEAWHEKYGAQTVQLTVVAGQPAVVEVAYVAQ